MARRPIFVPDTSGPPFFREILVEFTWHPGLSKSQAQKSIGSLHTSAAQAGISPVLEISSKSTDSLGVSLSAFNLSLQMSDHPRMSVECAFQGSKVFEGGGPYTDLYLTESRDAKRDERIRTSGKLVAFRFLGEDFPTVPPTAFYDWLYVQALVQNPEHSRALANYRGFSDIAFNPEKSWNCQARSAAIFVALMEVNLISDAANKDTFLKIMTRADLSDATTMNTQLSLNLGENSYLTLRKRTVRFERL